ncbi:siderophore ABC transporter substrate-binding protein [Acinetobacter guillouiae]|uniref:Siderophore ABC transporter substrate-binding protein n=1 Tax=Acinetobacter guillouiae TaxID=106649 RepID=A0A8X8KEA3_ACIGI|nr:MULTISPECIES: siderophore ABC transporter substrate-binding protein [Acinetobacter]MCF0264475.1 siderophore ABC transporter substrate-binding protein [Acinetobacter guillouiae]MCS4298006.1 iron complex transport system substrate-binding protein [Acinetobacter guillouiae]MCU4491952.1 siderophore ABC transporter substrate-binding protein [Acinetobacter guillouiae]MCW2251610.1 iron complex transport system substrate-binding protein [Acinetobacter sp. BIGb0204]NII35892.1 iron complex transport 
MKWKNNSWNLALSMIAAISLSGCDKKPAADANQGAQKLATPIVVKHELGTTSIAYHPQRAAVLDMNEADFLDQLSIPIAGMPKDYVPHFLQKYKDDQKVQDLGAIVQPNMERIYTLKPDIILMTPLQANQYQALSKIAPTVHYDINFNNSQQHHIEAIKAHLITLGQIFNQQQLATQKVDALDAKVAEVRKITVNRPEKALVVLHNNGAFSNFGVQSRYGFVFNAFGVKPASTVVDTSLHGQPISSEFIKQADPDILYIVDRTAVMEHRPTIDAERMSNPLLRQTKAWKNGKVVFVDADAWYITAASPTSMHILIDDVIKGYQL